MFQYLIAWFTMLISFLLIDGIWLGLVARNFYRSRIGDLMREQIWLGTAGLFYTLYTLTVLILVVIPAYRSGNLSQAVMLGALFGLCAYGTYDITNLATLRGWPVSVAIVDMLWGATLTCAVSAIGYLALVMIRPS